MSPRFSPETGEPITEWEAKIPRPRLLDDYLSDLDSFYNDIAAVMVYRLLGASENLREHYREPENAGSHH